MTYTVYVDDVQACESFTQTATGIPIPDDGFLTPISYFQLNIVIDQTNTQNTLGGMLVDNIFIADTVPYHAFNTTNAEYIANTYSTAY